MLVVLPIHLNFNIFPTICKTSPVSSFSGGFVLKFQLEASVKFGGGLII